MPHDLCKPLATVGKRTGAAEEVIRRILNHTELTTDVLYRHYVLVGGRGD
jgi:hypothetical protein